MAGESGNLDQAVSRALRESLGTVQRTAEELRQAVEDLVASCASTRPANALPALLRAETSAAALAATLQVLSRFVTGTLQAAPVAVEAPGTEPSPRPIPAPMAEAGVAAQEMVAEGGPVAPPEPAAEAPPPAEEAAPEPVSAEEFDLSKLSGELQEVHRRASRAAKVSMQDIKLIRPKELKEARENKDICQRLYDDIDKARKEYDRRFKAILNHPVDYFYQWMVDILAEGDPEKLGEYPYPSPVRRNKLRAGEGRAPGHTRRCACASEREQGVGSRE
jgi:hypothetical protein